jgi:hypothetical protein
MQGKPANNRILRISEQSGKGFRKTRKTGILRVPHKPLHRVYSVHNALITSIEEVEALVEA